MRVVKVGTATPYEVLIGAGVLGGLGERVRGVSHAQQVALITDNTVAALYGDAAAASLAESGFSVARFAFPHGEASKNLGTLSDILEFLAESGLRRGDLVVALGGGVPGDIAGFAAAVYMRGIDSVQVPTTLLAAVDSSVGGKTAVDLRGGKNLAGAFWQPRLVLCDTDILRDLPSPIFVDGLAEVIKYGVIADEALLAAVEAGQALPALPWLVARSVEIKQDIVERDERDHGPRQLLNYGHTVGHAIEHLSGFAITHGQAVATGMCVEARMASALGLLGAADRDRILRTVASYGFALEAFYPPEALTRAMRGDKKNEGDGITFVLPTGIGGACVRALDEATVCALLATQSAEEGEGEP